MDIRIDKPADGVWNLVLDRADRLNALDDAMVADLLRALRTIGHDAACRTLILTGAGRGFCAGFDLSLANTPPSTDVDETSAWMQRQEAFAAVVTHIREMRQPVIAAVNGAATGAGLGLALAADLRIACEAASFSAAFIKVGMSSCDIGVSYLLPRSVGAAHAFDIMLTGRTVDAQEAARIGLVSRLVPASELVAEAHKIAAQIAQHHPFAVWMTKRGMWANLESASLQAALELENRTQILTRTTGELSRAAAVHRNRKSAG